MSGSKSKAKPDRASELVGGLGNERFRFWRRPAASTLPSFRPVLCLLDIDGGGGDAAERRWWSWMTASSSKETRWSREDKGVNRVDPGAQRHAAAGTRPVSPSRSMAQPALFLLYFLLYFFLYDALPKTLALVDVVAEQNRSMYGGWLR